MKFFEKIYSYENMLSDDMQFSLKYPAFYSGSAIAKTVENRRIILIKLGSGKSKAALYIGAHHGREFISSAFLMGMCDYLCRMNSMYDYKTIDFFKEYTLHIIPMLNPDGVSIAINTQPNRKANANGVDLNRNYPCMWEEVASVNEPAYMGFKGFSSASEIEVKAVMELTSKNDYTYALTFHGFGEEIIYSDILSDNIAYSLLMAEKISCLSGFMLCPETNDYSKFGGFENYFRKEYRKPCLLIELGVQDMKDITCLNTEKYRKLYGLPLILKGVGKGV